MEPVMLHQAPPAQLRVVQITANDRWLVSANFAHSIRLEELRLLLGGLPAPFRSFFYFAGAK